MPVKDTFVTYELIMDGFSAFVYQKRYANYKD